MDRLEFDRALRRARTPHDRVAWFGALLSNEARLVGRLTIVGGSAIEVYLTSSKYVSEGIDVVGDKRRIAPVLRRWGFEPVKGRDGRVYWGKAGFGLVDLVGAEDRSGLPARREPTPFGDSLLSPVEYLIVRRLVMARASRSEELLRQATALALQYGRTLDWDYIRIQSRFEKVLPLLRTLEQTIAKKRR